MCVSKWHFDLMTFFFLVLLFCTPFSGPHFCVSCSMFVNSKMSSFTLDTFFLLLFSLSVGLDVVLPCPRGARVVVVEGLGVADSYVRHVRGRCGRCQCAESRPLRWAEERPLCPTFRYIWLSKMSRFYSHHRFTKRWGNIYFLTSGTRCNLSGVLFHCSRTICLLK